MSDDWQTFTARVLQGHRVASGLNGNPRFPGGTLKMQEPFFRELGVDLGAFYLGTINASIAPNRYVVRQARHTYRSVKWHPVEPAEDFSFFDLCLLRPGHEPLTGFIYFPHPETKPEHFQKPDVLELLLPHVEGLHYGMELTLQAPAGQILIEGVGTPA